MTSLDNELAARWKMIPDDLRAERLIDFDDPAATRTVVRQLWLERRSGEPVPAGVSVDRVSGSTWTLDLYRPQSRSRTPRAALLWIHGGGLVVGHPDYEAPFAHETVLAHDCVVAVAGYRLVPEGSYPHALDDCWAGLRWLVDNAADLKVDPRRITVGGASAGAGLAACLALRARDAGRADIAGQILLQPMLDDRSESWRTGRGSDLGIWTPRMNARAWKLYLPHLAPGADVPPTAAAARASDVAGLPPAYLEVGTADLFYEQTVDFADRLSAAGVATQLEIWRGASHGFENLAPDSRLVRSAREVRSGAFARYLTSN